MILKRTDFGERGIFGALLKVNNEEVCKTLEHAYPQVDGSFAPKIPKGDYLCVRGVHQLSKGLPFETFEVTGIFGHTGLLFHSGNKNEDSNGCILLGQAIESQNVVRSRKAFANFMDLLMGVDAFTLWVI